MKKLLAFALIIIFILSLIIYLAKGRDIVYLPVYELNLNPDNYVFLSRNLPGPAQTRILTAEYKKSVPAKFNYQGQEYNVDVRYYGTDFAHWARTKKSWQIIFDDIAPFNSQTVINLIIPEEQDMYLKALSHYRAKKMGLVVPESQFVVLKVNGQTQGVYWQVEDFTPAFLERNHLPVGNLYRVVDGEWQKAVRDEISKDDNYAELALLLDLLNNTSDEEFFNKIPFILDIDNLLKWQVHSLLMGNFPAGGQNNLSLYWHPALGKFSILSPVSNNPLVKRVLTNPEWLKQRNRILADYVSNQSNLEADLAYFDQLVKQTQTAIFQDYRKNFSNHDLIRHTELSRQQMIDRFTANLPEESAVFSLPAAVRGQTIINSEFKDFDKLFQPPQKLVYSGVNYINQTIVIPPGYPVKLLDGSKFIFAPDTSFVSYSPVQAQGATLTAQDPAQPWGVFAVVGQAAANSSFNQVIVEHGSQAVVNGTYFTGALAIQGAKNTIVRNSIVRSNHGDDGLNIKYDPRPQIVNNQFIANEWDGLDLDFSQGEVSGNVFLNNGNDGLDFGSASSLVKDNLVDGAGDKCISLGETSNARIYHNILKNCNMAIAVKDSSQPEIIDNQITNNHIGLSSYQKKPIFPRKPFIFRDNVFLNNEIDFQEENL